MPIFEQKSGRVYQVGRDFFEFEQSIIDTLIEWNLCSSESIDIDERFVITILLVLIPAENISAFDRIPDEYTDFIHGEQF